MDEVVRIAPLESEPGLIAYECPACCYVTSVLLQSKSSQSGSHSLKEGHPKENPATGEQRGLPGPLRFKDR
jgi:hypothetical protein